MKRVLSFLSATILAMSLYTSPADAGTGLAKYNFTVTGLPGTCVPTRPYWVNDAASDSDCTTGGGSTFVICQCQADGISYSAFAVAGSGDVTAVGSMLSGAAFADLTADDDCLGLATSPGGAAAICFDNQSTDEIIMYGDVGVGLADPVADLHVEAGDSGFTITTAYEMALEGSTALDFLLAAPDASDISIWFGVPTLGAAQIEYNDNHATGPALTLESAANGIIDLLRHDSSVALRITPTGDVQIGGDTNAYMLQLAETDSPGTCDATARGQMYYDISMGHQCVCDGTNWVDGVGTTCT